MSSLAAAMLAAPDPKSTIFELLRSLPVSSSALYSAASMTPAVPCWSSCQTGIFILALSLSRMSKQRGEAMSSRLIPPRPGSSASATAMNSSSEETLTGIGMASTPPRYL